MRKNKKLKRNNHRKKIKKSSLDFSSLKRIFIFGVGGGGLLSLCVLLGDHVMKHPPRLFDIREIVVASGTPHLSELDILKLTEIKIGDDLLTLPLKGLKEKMERYLWVKKVHLLKRYPHRLYVKIEEHKPRALVDLGGLYLINRSGAIFKKVASTDPKNFPVMTGFSKKDFKNQKGQAQYRLRQALRILDQAEKNSVIRDYGISEIHWDNREGFILYTMRPITQIKIGKSEFVEKFKRFAKAWPFIAITSKEPKMVDLTYERRVIVRYEAS